MDNNNNNGEQKVGVLTTVILIVFCLIFLGSCISCFSCGSCIPSCSDCSSNKRKWSDLSDTERDNARWAYEAKQFIDSQK